MDQPEKIILFYQFAPIADVQAVKLWQNVLSESLGLKGRIIISPHGINGTLGGPLPALKAYVKQTKLYPAFKAVDFKWSSGSANDFPRLSVKIRHELVTFGVPEAIAVNNKGIIGGGARLKPEQLNALVSEKGDSVVLVDGRNRREAAIGRFRNALVMDVDHTRDFPSEIKKSKYRHLKDKTVVTYCTGGIRCEVLTKLMKDAGYAEVYQLDGGIVNYLKHYPDDGLWEGSLFLFDNRMSFDPVPGRVPISHCSHCTAPTANYENCDNLSCNELILLCVDCASTARSCEACRRAAELKA